MGISSHIIRRNRGESSAIELVSRYMRSWFDLRRGCIDTPNWIEFRVEKLLGLKLDSDALYSKLEVSSTPQNYRRVFLI